MNSAIDHIHSKELINELLKEYKLSDKLKERRIIEQWRI